ncbi:electron transfer flavoprotein subunit alpha [Actinotalea ferrariae CF5-4]|uniref:Electron transfer flavoprotein subunit alpha n=1 Tax=Actinotalea ferrariae CF5-4 TaxID=948458 RepID=A0A021VRK8_9CELL|nr:electron transfer flavoprotein subunit alpha/FixB family protein [Actinotalea ferrariae]EYR63771.1 electron transfer flavoprotein subunit alpha [Actinotalea ferrariae CF5-4]
MTSSGSPSDVASGDVVLVVVDHQGTTVRNPALELLTAARAIGRPEAVWLGGDAPAGAALETLGTHGAGVVHHLAVDPGGLLPAQVAQVLRVAVEATGARTVLLTSTFENKEASAHLAFHLGAGLVVDAAGVERDDDGALVTVQQAFAGTWTLRSVVTAEHAVVALKANAVPAEVVDGAPVPQVVAHPVVADASVGGATLVERTERPVSERPSLTEAQVVVVGGRGTNGDFSAVEDLADALGGAVGATRVATDEGWIGHEAQIGQTGVTVSPRLYVGAGVSGAVHHRGGMQSSGTIVAINNDPEAPIFEIADYGIVGDLTTVLPQTAAEVRRLRAESGEA